MELRNFNYKYFVNICRNIDLCSYKCSHTQLQRHATNRYQTQKTNISSTKNHVVNWNFKQTHLQGRPHTVNNFPSKNVGAVLILHSAAVILRALALVVLSVGIKSKSMK